MKIEKDNFNFSNNLKKISNCPEKVYVEGNLKLLKTVGIAVIGSRHNTSYGKRMCEFFTRELVKYGLTIISGMAEGIDTIAHKTCIANNGSTIAVLPCGLNRIYPKSNTELFQEILNHGGAVVSEYDSEVQADSKKFLERNRIVSGLSIGTLVIEAGYRSGTSVTARLTKEQKKKVFCVPSSLENYKGITCNKLIKEGAKLVTCIEDILNEFPEIKFTRKEFKVSNDLIEDEFLDVYNFLSYQPQYINDIAKKTENSISDAIYKLTMLELEGHIVQLPGKYYIRK
ncbi:MAG: DNA-processing protein DprA [Clostridia bacterium]|nr:DNA-processing protein DprA [Clostridia bacterium]